MLNYAKNEIYARHGRKFKAKELSDYFQSMGWYSVTINPDDFDESTLSTVESQNAAFLSKAEKEMSEDGNGYRLNQEGYKYDEVYARIGGITEAAVTPPSTAPAPTSGYVEGYIESAVQEPETEPASIVLSPPSFSTVDPSVLVADDFCLTMPQAGGWECGWENQNTLGVYYSPGVLQGYGGCVMKIIRYSLADESYKKNPMYAVLGSNSASQTG